MTAARKCVPLEVVRFARFALGAPFVILGFFIMSASDGHYFVNRLNAKLEAQRRTA